MKLTKKKVLVSALAVSLIAILSAGSLAWFSSKDEVTNEFMITTSDAPDDPDKIFSIDLMEAVDIDGPEDTNGDENPDATIAIGKNPRTYQYQNLLPGDKRAKQPIVINTGVYDQYVRVKVTVSDAAAWAEILATHGLDLEDVIVGHNEQVWTRNDAETVADTQNDKLTYVYYLNDVLEPNERAVLFTHFVLPEEVTQADMAKLVDGVSSMHIVAEAVQTRNVGRNAIEAFDTVMDN